MALYEVYKMVGETAHSVLITGSKEQAIKLAHKLQLKGISAFWEQIN